MPHPVPLAQADSATAPPAHSFLDDVIAATPGDSRLEMCIQCGTCGGSCPSGPDMDYTPRRIIALIRADQREAVLHSNTPWYCVSCYYCMTRCPQDIHVTDVMYSLKRMAVREGHQTHGVAPDFSKTFIFFVENFGRSFELGLATGYHLTHSPQTKVVGIAMLATGMLRRNRLAFTPQRIKGLEGLQAILNKAKAMTREAAEAGDTRLL